MVPRPARYTLLTSLGLALLAGQGLDRSIGSRKFWSGIILAILVGAAAWAWSIHWAHGQAFQLSLGARTLAKRFTMAGLAWALGLTVIIAWRKNWLGAWAALLTTSLELGGLFFIGPLWWHWAIPLPEMSPVLMKLAALPDVGLIGGRLLNLPVSGGQTIAYPNFGIPPPPPNYLLDSATLPPAKNDEVERHWQRRFGVTHGVWASGDAVWGTEILATINDPVLDLVMLGTAKFSRSALGPWKVVRLPGAFPPAWVARTILESSNWGSLFLVLSQNDAQDEAWFLAKDPKPPFASGSARVSTVRSWDGHSAIVTHDGSCILILRRTFYPGWTYRVDDGPEQAVLKVNGGLQGIPLLGSGTSRVMVRYQPTRLARAIKITLTALAAAVFALVTSTLPSLRVVLAPLAIAFC